MARGIAVDVLDEVWRRDSTPPDAACRYCGASVVHSVRRPTEAARAHFDVVDPNEPATVDNVVVACPACNMRKGNRTPSEAGMTLTDVPGTQRESGADRSADTDTTLKAAFTSALGSLVPKVVGTGYNFDLPAEHWATLFAEAVRAVAREEAAAYARVRDAVRPVNESHSTTVSLCDAGKPVLSIIGADASRVREAAAAIRAAESAAGA